MVIIYIVSGIGRGERWLSARDGGGMCFRPTECQWIVPGTITE